MPEKQMCLACNDRPATSSGPVPMCSVCKRLAEGKERGVKFEKNSSGPDPSLS